MNKCNLDGLNELITMEHERHQYILDVKAQECHKHYMIGLETARDIIINDATTLIKPNKDRCMLK